MKSTESLDLASVRLALFTTYVNVVSQTLPHLSPEGITTEAERLTNDAMPYIMRGNKITPTETEEL